MQTLATSISPAPTTLTASSVSPGGGSYPIFGRQFFAGSPNFGRLQHFSSNPNFGRIQSYFGSRPTFGRLNWRS